MKPRALACSAVAALLLCGLASAQGASGNQNDLRLENGGDFLYVYDDPSIGPEVHDGTIAERSDSQRFTYIVSADYKTAQLMSRE